MQLRRRADSAAEPIGANPPLDDAQMIQSLAARVAHLERQLEGLQDAMHREQTRQNKRIGELESRTEPAALAIALNKDERDRGL
jgi:hypothetical protein